MTGASAVIKAGDLTTYPGGMSRLPRDETPTWFLQTSSALPHWGLSANGTPRLRANW
jgi:hypothetical protein